ncbi:MAG: TIGR01212 family radical SAM protein [Bacteroidaceae bacterium]|nr:TIGR01212 family radical SAM protein [Bacteroidaceae bacterium]
MKESLYLDFPTFMRRHFDCRVQKISVDAGFTCPNRDGTLGKGGCSYCNNRTFNPAYCNPAHPVRQQVEEGVQFFAHKYPEMKYLAYFQAYTNTYCDLSHLISLYEEALSVPGVIGLVIGTRPDCLPDELLEYLEQLSKRTFVIVEYGIESVNDDTLRRINRGHTFAQSAEAVERTASRGIFVGAHMILGLPGESEEEMLRQPALLSALSLTILKLHQLQIIKDTRMAKEFATEPSSFHLYDVDEYINLVIRYIERLRPDIVLERFVSSSPKELLIAPDWKLKNYEYVERLKKRMRQLGTWQGRLYSK